MTIVYPSVYLVTTVMFHLTLHAGPVYLVNMLKQKHFIYYTEISLEGWVTEKEGNVHLLFTRIAEM